jgi:hypothetical protein
VEGRGSGSRDEYYHSKYEPKFTPSKVPSKDIRTCVGQRVSDKIMSSLRPKLIWSQGLVTATFRKLR